MDCIDIIKTSDIINIRPPKIDYDVGLEQISFLGDESPVKYVSRIIIGMDVPAYIIKENVTSLRWADVLEHHKFLVGFRTKRVTEKETRGLFRKRIVTRRTITPLANLDDLRQTFASADLGEVRELRHEGYPVIVYDIPFATCEISSSGMEESDKNISFARFVFTDDSETYDAINR